MQASYDNKKNPFKSFSIKIFPYRSVEQVLSSNNVVQKKYSDGTTVNYEYQYFDTGLPKEARQITISGSNSVVRTIEFYYE